MSNRSEVISMRFTAEDADRIRGEAAQYGQTIADYIRGRIGWAAITSRPGARVFRTARGASVAFWSASPVMYAAVGLPAPAEPAAPEHETESDDVKES